MKKTLLSILAAILFVSYTSTICYAKTMEAQVESHRIPAGTILKLKT